MRTKIQMLTVAFLLCVSLLACDDGGSVQASGTITLSADQGVNLVTGQLQDPGNFANSDIFTSTSGATLKLSTGGSDPTVNRPVTWFRSVGGIVPTFGALDEVPDIRPDDSMTASLVIPETGNGFVVKNADGSYTRGWLQSVGGSSVTIEFVPSVPEFE
jgi:hypothetical protein